MDRRFWASVLIAACLLTAIVHADMFTGKVPFPSFFVFMYAPFLQSAPGPFNEPANIGDLVTSFYPFRAIAARAAADGEIPLWNPYFLSGTPLLASSQSAVFYPLTALYYVFSTPIAWGLASLLRMFLVILFTAAFMRSIGGTTTGAMTSALLFAFGGFLTVWQGQAMNDAVIWLPLACLAVVRLHKRPASGSIVLGAFTFAMPVLGGHPETAVHITITAVALAGFLFVTAPSRKFVLAFLAAGLLAGGLAAVQILPTAEWSGLAYRSLTDAWSPQPLWSLLGWVSRDVLHSTNSFGLQIPEMAAYIGMMAFVAAPLAFLGKAKKFAWFFGAWTAIVLSVAYGVGPAYWLSLHTPIVQAVKNSRLIFVGCFGLAVLAGLGISAIECRTHRVRAALLMGSGCTLALAMIYALRTVTTAMAEPSRYPRTSAMLLVLCAVPVLLRLAGKLNGNAFRFAILAIVSLDVLTFTRGFMPFTQPKDIFPRVDLFDRIPRQEVEPDRIMQVFGVYPENTQSMYGLSAAGGYEICLRRIKEFVMDLTPSDISSVDFIPEKVLSVADRRIDMLNARYVLVSELDSRHTRFRDQPERFRFLYSTGGTSVYENLRVLPAAYLVAAGAAVVTDDAAALERIKDPGFDPRQTVLLPVALKTAGIPEVASSLKTAAVEWRARTSNRFELNVTAPQRSVLVVSQIYYPGWVAFVDGQRTEVFPANFALTGIEVPPGDHRVHFEFQSPSFRAGLSITAVAAALLIGLAATSLRSRVKPSASSNS